MEILSVTAKYETRAWLESECLETLTISPALFSVPKKQTKSEGGSLTKKYSSTPPSTPAISLVNTLLIYGGAIILLISTISIK